MEHLSRDLLLRFFMGQTSCEENRGVLRHLLSRCSECAAVLNDITKRPMNAHAYDSILDRLEARSGELNRLSRPQNSSLPGATRLPV